MELQQEQQMLQAEHPLPRERLQKVDGSIADCSAALQKQFGLLAETQQVLSTTCAQSN